MGGLGGGFFLIFRQDGEEKETAGYKAVVFRGILTGERRVRHESTQTAQHNWPAPALSLAVLTSATAAAWRRLPWARADAGGAAAVEAGETATEFLLTDRNGEVCVYAGETLISSTGIPVRSLPRQDREDLEKGIRARGERELAALLEDFGA